MKFFEIPVWKDAHSFSLKIYKVTSSKFSKNELFGLTSQIRRSSTSMGANIAEGSEQDSIKMKINYLTIAKASALETENHLILAKDLEYLSESDFSGLYERCESILKQLGGWIKKLKN